MEKDASSSSAPVLVVLGRQGAGKGEQAARLAERHGFDHLSTGALLRAAARSDTPVGRASDDYLIRGEAVPDAVVNGLVAERLARAAIEGRGLVLDGYPRSVAQAVRLGELLAPRSVDVAIHIDVPRHIAVTRIQNRRVCTVCEALTTDASCPRCGGRTARRADDWPEAIGRRMSDYAQHMDAVLRWYEDCEVLQNVDGVGTIDEVATRVEHVLARSLGTGATS